MNKYIKIMTVFFMLMNIQYSLSMQSLGKYPLVKIQPPLDRSFHEHQKMLDHLDPFRHSNSVKLNTHQDILHSFGREPIQETTKRYISLPENEKQKVMDALPQRKQCELMMGNEVTKFSILCSLFNGNQKIAIACTKKPLSETVCRYNKAQHLMKKYPITYGDVSFGEQHYMVLADKEAQVLSSIFGKGFVYKDQDVDCLINAFSKLQHTDSQLKKLPKRVTDQIKLYPSLRDRTTILLNIPGGFIPLTLSFSCFVGTSVLPFMLVPVTLCDYWRYSSSCVKRNLKEAGKIGLCSGSMAVFFLALDLTCKYPHYKNILKNNVLPTQPSLTALLHERAIQSKPQ